MQPYQITVEYEKWYVEAYVLMNPIDRCARADLHHATDEVW